MSFPDRTSIEAEQLTGLRNLFAAIAAGNRFYTQIRQAAGIEELPQSIGEFRAGFPFTTKADISEDQRRNPPYGTNLTFPLERYTRCHQTSGTTGDPLRWLDTPESWEWMLGNWRQVFETAGIGAGDRVFFAFSFGPFLGFWTAYEAALSLGCFCLAGGGMSSRVRLAAMAANRINVLCCTPTYALHLAGLGGAEAAARASIPLRRIVVAGEPGGSIPAIRSRLETAWPGARVWDHHGMTEVGPATHQCPAHPGRLHLLEPGYLGEVLHPGSGETTPPGREGELVLTTLGRTASPLIRYRTGDLVCPLPPGRCDCGRATLALEGGILGRVDDMVIIRGVNIHPAAVEEVIRRFPEVQEYRVEVRRGAALAELNIVIEPAAEVVEWEDLTARVAGALRLAFGLKTPVTAVPPGALDTGEMKTRRWRMENE